eukprot:TRINITY_DN29929_c6_g1_i1.p1 TRINITY_DN29929_c6_g1~~TRINITY_DN29929_c6_g1_i1.p1  ORF type:complete len:260 (-),score=11.04 TRINITY_DN29929_c6_g1_i1:458-1237(-)
MRFAIVLILTATVHAVEHGAPPGSARKFEHDGFAPYLDRLKIWKEDAHALLHQSIAVSGPGSNRHTTWPFVKFLRRFLARWNASSLVEASCGHWPSGWQAHVRWPGRMAYAGVDILPEMIEQNSEFVRQRGVQYFGLESTRWLTMDMTRQALPDADVLLTKDTLIHINNERIQNFLSLNVMVCPPKFRHVLFVHRQYYGDKRVENNLDIDDRHFHLLDLKMPPFNLPTVEQYAWGDPYFGANVVEYIDMVAWCSTRQAK